MEPFIWAKVFDFSWTTIKKILSLIFKILVIVGLPILALWGVYVLTIKPHTNPLPTTTQNQAAEEIINTTINYYPNKRVFALGGSIFGFDLGIVKYDNTKEPTIKTKSTKK
jgi:hypothetical protein